MPISCGFPVFFPVRDKPLAAVNSLRWFASVFSGLCSLAVTRRDRRATWRALGTLYDRPDWSQSCSLFKDLEPPRRSHRTSCWGLSVQQDVRTSRA
jgi:hypothetical protein